MAIPSSPIDLRQTGPWVPELCSDKQTNRQTEITTLYLYQILCWGIPSVNPFD